MERIGGEPRGLDGIGGDGSKMGTPKIAWSADSYFLTHIQIYNII